MRCHYCIEGLEHCHEVSIEHADGLAECGGDGRCTLPHHLHDWRISCAELEPPCPCAAPVEAAPDRGFHLPERLAA